MNSEMRISDILSNETLNSEEEEDKGFINVEKNREPIDMCCSVRSVLSRWIPSSLKRSSRRDSSISSRPRLAEASLNCEEDSQLLDDGSKSKSGLFVSPPDSEIANSSGRYMKDDSFSLGLGAGFVFLMVACKNEFNKMTKLQSQVELFIKDVKNEIRREDVICQPSKSNILSFSTTSSSVVENTNYNPIIRNHASPHDLVRTEVVVGCDQHFEFSQPKEECVQGIDQLEAEFEAELERLQFNLDTEDSLEHSQQEQEMIDENTALVRSHSSSNGVVDDPVEMDNGEQSGVSPYELERRLHELVEARQQERIKELECALECAKQKLHEKEIEVSVWKNTASLLTQHVSEGSCLSR